MTGYKFDECNNDGMVSWYDTSAYDERAFEYIRVQMGIIDMEDIDLLVDLPKSER